MLSKVSDLTPRAPDIAQGARGLGWASVGIALAELIAPQRVEKLLGLSDRPAYRGILRTLGVRELMHGVSLLTHSRPTKQMAAGLWSRVARDMLDNVLLGMAARKTKRPAVFAAIAASVLVIGALDMLHAARAPIKQAKEE